MPDAARLQVRVEADVTAAEQGLRSLGQQINGFGESVRSGLGIGAGIAAFQEGLRLLEGGFGALKSSVIDFNQQLDMANTTFLRYFQGNQAASESFLASLKQFANVTPFEFKDLVPLAVKLQNANVNAQDLIPTLKAIGEASSATGQISSVSIGRIGLALTQMNQTGHVTGQDMRQLTEALVPAWQILADATGKPIPVLQKLTSEGKISSEVFLDAFRKYYEGTNLMEAASKTLGGALSTIRDVGTQALADIGRSMYDLATQGANQFAKFLSSDDFKVWAEVGKSAVDGLVNAFKGLMSSLEPLISGIQDAFKKATSGDFTGALASLSNGVKTQLGVIWESVTSFASRMVGAGSNLIGSFADGMMTGGYNAIVAAMDAITSFIASVLIGNSPPPAGPLAQIDQGGANTAKAWVEPFGMVLKAGVGAAVTAVAGTINQLKDASIDIAGQIRDVTDQMQALDHVMRGLKDTIDTVKAGFTAQKQSVQDLADATKDRYASAIQGVRDQIDTIKDSHQRAADAIQHQIDTIKDGYTDDINSIKDAIGSIKDSYADAEAGIQRHIDLLKDKYTSAIDGVRSQIARITDEEEKQLAPLQRQLSAMQDANKFLKERQDAEGSIANAKTQQLQLEALGDPALRAQLAGQLAGLDVQQQRVDLAQQLADAQKKLSEGGLSDAERKSLDLKIQQLQIQEKLANMVDTTKLAEATRQADLEAAQEKQLATTRAIQDAHQKIAEIPIEQKMASIKASAESALAPLQTRLRDLEVDQKRALDPLQARLKDLKAEEQGLLLPLQSRLHDLEYDQRNALEPLNRQLKDVKENEKELLAPLEQRLKGLQHESDLWGRVFSGELKDIDRQQREALAPLQSQLDLYQHQKDALTDQKQELEAIKARIQESIQLQQQAAREAKEAAGNVPTKPVDRSFTGDPTAGISADAAKARGAALAGQISEGFATWFDEHKAEIGTRIVGFFVGGLIGGPIGAIAGAAFLPQFMEKLQEKLKERGFDAQPFINALGESAKTGDYREPAFQIASGITFAITRLPWTIAKAIWGAISAAWANSDTDSDNVGRAIMRGIGDGLKRMFSADLLDLGGLARGIFVGIGNALREMTAEISKASAIVGTAIWDGVGAGLKAGFVGVGDLLRASVALMIGIFKQAFGIASPSTVMQEIGVQIIDGLLLGVTTKWADLKKWLEGFGGIFTDAFNTYVGGPVKWLVKSGEDTFTGLRDGIQGFWDKTLKTWLEGAGDWVFKAVETYGGGALKWLVSTGEDVLHGMQNGVQTFWDQTLSPWLSGAGDWVIKAFRSYVGGPIAWLDKTGSDVLHGMKNGIQTFWDTDLLRWLSGAGDWVIKAFTSFAGGPLMWLVDTGSKILEGMKDGLFSWLEGDYESPLSRWIRENLTDKLPNWVKHALGINSPSTVFHSIGQSLIDGLINGMQERFPAISSFISMLNSTLGGAGGGAPVTGDLQDWLTAAMQAEGVDPGKWQHGLGWLAMHESGGQADPPHNNDARGVMQTIPSTFDAFRDRSLPDDIFNPIANIAASIRYIQQEYETGHKTGYPIDIDGIISQWGRPGTFFENGYATGGIAWEPQIAHLAENEPEAIIPKSWFAHAGGQDGDTGGTMQTIRVMVETPSGQSAEDIWITGYRLHARRGSLPARFGDVP